VIAIQSMAQPFLRTKGREIVTTEGKSFAIKGINLGNWLVPEGYMFHFKKATSPRLINETITELIGPYETEKFWQQYVKAYITSTDIHYLKTAGINSIRLPFNYRLFTDEIYLGGSGMKRAFSIVDSLVKWCKKENIYVLLDMHCAPGGQTGDNIDDSYGYPFLFESAEAQDVIINIWKQIAAHYANDPTIMGYDLLNEPIPPFYDTAFFNPRLEPLYKRITQAIRKVDKRHIIFLGGAQWDSNFDVFGKPFDDNVVYTFHKYWTQPIRKVVQPYIDFSNKYNVPIYCGETGENTDEWIKTFRQMLDSNQIGWHFWPYKKMDNSRCMVSFKEPGNYNLISMYADTIRASFKDIQKNRPGDMKAVREALDEFLKNCRFENCYKNEGYVRALDFLVR
ncbi:MAG TPA: cellulase family glycosylhydrolase, partial [Chitinophagaceae bacterium]